MAFFNCCNCFQKKGIALPVFSDVNRQSIVAFKILSGILPAELPACIKKASI
jgi:hypothetical protein